MKSNSKELHKPIVKAMGKSDKALPVPPLQVGRSGGFTGQIADLEVGEACSKIGQPRPEMTLAEFAETSASLKANFRNNIMPSVRGAKVQTGGDYSVEVTTVVTTPGVLYFVAIVSRVK